MLAILKPLRETLTFLLAKISEKSRKSKHFSYIYVFLKIESRVQKCKSIKITLQMSFLSYICVRAHWQY